MTAKHADFEALSAFVDGEAPEWADHVAGCPRCRAAAAELRALSATVARPADPPAPAQREAAIAAALGAAAFDNSAVAGATRPLEAAGAARHDAQTERFGRSEPGRLRRPQWGSRPWAMPAVAAVVVALLGLSGVILSANRSTDENATTFAGPAPDAKTESAVPGAPSAPVGDLGEVPDAATLRARALAVGAASAAGGAATASGRATSSAGSGASADATATTGPPPAGPTSGVTGGAAGAAGGAGGSAALIAPNVVGTRPCEERARTREPVLGPVTYFATARHGGVPAYVLGFATGPTVTLLMLAQDGCSELLRSAGP